MAQQSPPRSRVVPVMVAALVCDVAVVEPNTGKKTLIGIFTKIGVSKFPTKCQMTLYMKLSDAEGYYQMNVKFVQLKSGKIVANAQGKFRSTDRLASSDHYIPFPPLLIPEAGRYEFQIYANDVFLGSTFLDAEER